MYLDLLVSDSHILIFRMLVYIIGFYHFQTYVCSIRNQINFFTNYYMQKLLLKWRTWKIDIPMDYGNFTIGGKPDGYSLSFRYNASRKWYVENCGVNILDQLVNDYVDIGKVSGNARKDKLFAIVEFDETKIDSGDLAFDLENDYKDYGVRILPTIDTTDAEGNIIPSEAKTFLREFTNCPEENGVFTLRPELTNPTGDTIPAYTITL